MARRLFALIGLVLGLAPAAYAADQGRHGEIRHSGTIVEVGPQERMLTMEEMVAWTGPGTGIVKRSVALTADTSINLVKRSDDPNPKAFPGWESSVLKLSDLHPGDFITITTNRQQDRVVAVAIEVVRPTSTP
jgi:hypothetical protein